MEKRYLRIAAAARIQLHPPEHQEEGEERGQEGEEGHQNVGHSLR